VLTSGEPVGVGAHSAMGVMVTRRARGSPVSRGRAPIVSGLLRADLRAPRCHWPESARATRPEGGKIFLSGVDSDPNLDCKIPYQALQRQKWRVSDLGPGGGAG
jgi:hypothetical protein